MNNAEPERIRISRVYTRTGDDGLTGLVGGDRVAKHAPRIEAYGTVDEAAAMIAHARVALAEDAPKFAHAGDVESLQAHLRYAQNLLFVVGGELATPRQHLHPAMPVVTEPHIAYLEQLCDYYNGQLTPLKDFVLVGPSRSGTALHVARTVCRRAERCVTALGSIEEVSPLVQQFLNRLSDALFVLARWVEHAMGSVELVWDRQLQPPPLKHV